MDNKKLDLEPGRGVAFKGNKKTDKHPDYFGQLKTPSGDHLRLSMWLAKSGKGTPYLSLAIQDYDNRDTSNTEASKDEEFIPF